VNPVADAGHSV